MTTSNPSSHRRPPVIRRPLEEPDTAIFIDRGQPLPDLYPGGRLRLMVSDPNTLFIYWERPEALAHPRAWMLTLLNAQGDVLVAVTLDVVNTSVYINLPVHEVASVRLSTPEDVDTPLIATRFEGRALVTHQAQQEERWASASDAGRLTFTERPAPDTHWHPGDTTWVVNLPWSAERLEGQHEEGGLPSSASFVLPSSHHHGRG